MTIVVVGGSFCGRQGVDVRGVTNMVSAREDCIGEVVIYAALLKLLNSACLHGITMPSSALGHVGKSRFRVYWR